MHGVQPLPDANTDFSKIAIDEGGQLGLGYRTHLGRFDIAALEQHQGWNAANTKLGRSIGILVYIQLGNLETAAVLVGNFIKNRGDHLAWPAPVSPVIDQYRSFCVADFLLKRIICHINDFVAQGFCLRLNDEWLPELQPDLNVSGHGGTFHLNPAANASPIIRIILLCLPAMSETHLTEQTFHDFDLPASLMQGIEKSGFSNCTPIQANTLPHALQGFDVAGQAQTGTGKTAAFLIALYNHLLRDPGSPARRQNQPRALVLAPTRELAIQIHRDAETLGHFTDLKLGLAYGGTGYEQQRATIEAGIDILIGTPGRLIDYFKQRVFDLKAIQVLVVDEADRMFDLGFIADLRYMMRRMPAPQQRLSMLFSATLSLRVTELAYEHMNNPLQIEVQADQVTAERVRQSTYYPASDEKIPLLLGLLDVLRPARTIVFVNTKRVAERVWGYLEGNGYQTAILSGDVPQQKRQRLLTQFESGEFPVLVATDVAARGLHIPGVSHVINYDLPQDPEDYVHRIGRTARAGSSGEAISFACEEYAFSLADIEEYIGSKIPVEPIRNELLPEPLPARKMERKPQAHSRSGKNSPRTGNKPRRRRPPRDGQ